MPVADVRIDWSRVRYHASRWFWVPLGLWLLPLAAAAPRLGVAATYQRFHGDFAVRALFEGPLGYLIGWLLVSLCAATWFARRCLEWLAAGAAEGS